MTTSLRSIPTRTLHQYELALRECVRVATEMPELLLPGSAGGVKLSAVLATIIARELKRRARERASKKKRRAVKR